MNLATARQHLFGPRLYPLVALMLIGLVVAVFYVVGFQVGMRWVKLLMGLTLVGAISVSRLSVGLGLFLIASLFPAFIVIGPTNFPLSVLMFAFWLIKASIGREARPARTPCDIPLFVLTVAYAISWVNVERTPFAMQQAWYYTQNHIGSLMIFYMAYASVREERDVLILIRFMQIMALIIYGTALLEVTAGIAILGLGTVKGALYRFGESYVRAGGMFGSHDMLADFCSMNIPLHLFLIFRSRSTLGRLIYYMISVLCLAVMFMTSNRGGFIGFSVGLVYLGFLLRKEIGGKALAGAAAIGALVIAAIDTILRKTGKTISVIDRLAGTEFYGVLPETRVGVFRHFKERIAEHFWLGEGPYYRLRTAESTEFITWPHNALAYYWVTVGILGMVAFAVLMVQILAKSWQEKARRLGEGRAQELLLILHVMMVVFLVTEQRTDFQRGFVFTYYIFFLFGFTMGTWRYVRARRLAAETG